jgi:hypothetical protein
VELIRRIIMAFGPAYYEYEVTIDTENVNAEKVQGIVYSDDGSYTEAVKKIEKYYGDDLLCIDLLNAPDYDISVYPFNEGMDNAFEINIKRKK